MKTEGKVCSLEWAKKLQEAGIFVETEFVWRYLKNETVLPDAVSPEADERAD